MAENYLQGGKYERCFFGHYFGITKDKDTAYTAKGAPQGAWLYDMEQSRKSNYPHTLSTEAA